MKTIDYKEKYQQAERQIYELEQTLGGKSFIIKILAGIIVVLISHILLATYFDFDLLQGSCPYILPYCD